MAVIEPQSASDYDDRTTAAVKSVLVEIGQIFGSFKGKFAVIGGAVPWLLLRPADMPHSGTVDVDIGLDSAALSDGEFVRLVEALQTHGYHQRDNLRRFQLVRTVPAKDGGPDIDIVVDFLMPRDVEIAKNSPLFLSEFAVQRADGAELALMSNQMVAVVFKYEIIIYWSQEDEAFIAEVPELPGCAADGGTYQEALDNVQVIIREWIETARELGREIPEPKGRLIFA